MIHLFDSIARRALLVAILCSTQPAFAQSATEPPVGGQPTSEGAASVPPAALPPAPAGNPPATPSGDADDAKREHKDIVMAGDARCTRCHHDVTEGDTDAYPVLPIGRTKHGTRADARTPTCTSCHGDSESHLKQKGKNRPPPEKPFGKKVATDPKAHDRACLKCHDGSKRMHWAGSIHARRDVACSSCHRIHVEHDPATSREKVPELCISCHKEKRAQIARPSRHPILEGKMACPDCHNAHGSAGPKLMVRDSVNETCYSCHMEYRGPFLWNHQPVRQDCSLCHNPHGSTVAGLLKARPPFLCQQCHEPTSHRGSFPAVNSVNGNSVSIVGGVAVGAGGITMGRGCVNCHTNIHGGSNPTNAGNSRTNRR